MSNTSASPNPPSQTPKFIWPRTGQDLPRLPFADWLKVYALEVGKTFSGDLGFLLGQHILALAEHAVRLDAHTPIEYMRLSQVAADREAAYWASVEQALEECQHPDVFVIQVPDESPDGARRAWIASDLDDETHCN